MSKYTMYYTAKQQQYKNLASTWTQLASTMGLTDQQKKGMALFFKPIARRFGLVQEFKDKGMI